ncbi:Peptidoglycan/LPS O-acetylase OafA/YrhL, contains acyltransferase and SGNH-hydrolase domains [Paraoerskovia marina]|uniref:Peptidoglycan/LPS O-acetylase OafA/YrhL, contains acyltransferase and SGNH-hydrolase domains n=1 Tax=Paraoerskovia marina TaxID=545619 RepID=A0A1H1V2D0_9CELL|nr:acyltransferase family protein [Paraoerskovia marina]SDS78536.1 Peptidoglycan/LPS O-acetylase OafA/YrhL, contains acyltransferase and SGNH-hydrolase domains [Paraoerskovia marina]
MSAPTQARPTSGVRADGPRRDGPARGRIRGLDGLRALAVVAVVGYHVTPAALPGGFLGVDMFFVVSGFLITALLLRDLRRDGRLDLLRFWRRRARRLLPALALVVVVSVLAARVVEPDFLVGIRRQVFGAATFTSNWVEIAAGSSYFDQSAPVLFQTFWSLAIEEQFYLLWPVVLAALVALVPTMRARAAVALAGAALSALLMAVLVVPGGDPTRVYYGTDTHVFGLLLGCAAAFWWVTHPRLLDGAGLPGAVGRHLRTWAPVVAALGLTVLVLTLHSGATFTYRGGIVLGSLCAVVLVAACADATAAGETPFVRLLDARGLRWVGERSYGLYLWHWPVILLVDDLVGAQPGTVVWWRGTVVALGVTVALAAVSYRWVETPVRRDGFRATWLRLRGSLGRRGDTVTPALLARRTTAGVAATLLVASGVVIATAPAVSEAQLAVERGAAAVAAAADVEADPPASAELLVDGVVDGTQVSAFGDSVLSGAAPAVLERFPGIAIDAEPIRKWLDAPALLREAADAGELRDVVVLNFGTNGGFQFDGSTEALDESLATIGPDRAVVLVNSVGVSYWVPEANDALAALAESRPNVVVADWNGAVRAEPGLLHADRTHPNLEGIDVYADVLDDAIRGLASDG